MGDDRIFSAPQLLIENVTGIVSQMTKQVDTLYWEVLVELEAHDSTWAVK